MFLVPHEWGTVKVCFSNLNELDKEMSLCNLFFMIFFIALFFAKGMGFYEGQWPYDILVVIAYISLSIKILLSKYNLKELVVTILGMILGIVTWWNSGEIGGLLNLSLIVGMIGVNKFKIWENAYFIWIFTFIVQLLTSFAGININNIFRIHRKLGQFIIRWSLGYTHPNVLHVSFIILLMLMMKNYRFKGKKLIIFSAIALIGSLIVFMWSMSYTGLLISFIYVTFNLYLNFRENLYIFEKIILSLISPFAIFFSVFGPVLLTGKLFEIVDAMLSTRFTLSKYYLTTQPITFWGTNDFIIEDPTITIDSSYVYALMHYGIFYFAVMSVCLITVILWLVKNDRRLELAIVLSIAIAGITEQFLFNTSCKNIALLFVGEMICEKISNGKIVIKGFFNDKKIYFSYIRELLNKLKNIITFISKKTVVIIVLIGITTSAFYYFYMPHPDAIYALVWHCDRKDTPENDPNAENVYFDLDNMPEDFNGLILSYKDNNTPLYEFEGFTLWFEVFRRAIGYGIITVAILLLSYILVRYYKNMR